MTTFYQDAYHAWHYTTHPDYASAPMGAVFLCMNAPVANSKQWSITRFQVAECTDRHTGKPYRGYVVKQTQEYDECPVASEQIVYAEQRSAGGLQRTGAGCNL